MKRRVSRPTTEPATDPGRDSANEPRLPYRPDVIADLSRLALLFAVVTLFFLLFLLLALSFLFGHTPFDP